MQQIPENSGSDSHDATAASTSRESQPSERVKIQPSPRLIETLDLITLIGLVVMTPIAWLLPQHMWSKVGRFVVAVVMKLLPRTAAAIAVSIDHGLGPTSDRIDTNV
ncbi:MAG: hypothetical protein HW386_1595 [Gammaproteobacteria bacterium]|nr:hypothetical protein [Gammaproteobacteria bacterium]